MPRSLPATSESQHTPTAPAAAAAAAAEPLETDSVCRDAKIMMKRLQKTREDKCHKNCLKQIGYDEKKADPGGGAENAGVENAVDRMGGNCRSGKYGSENV